LKIIDTEIKIRNARKKYKCEICGILIPRGTRYESGYVQTEDMRVYPHKRCLDCRLIKEVSN